MPNSKQIVYLSQSQYAELIANGTITVDGVTVTYNENDIYVTPQAEPVTDVRINGTSVAANGVANIPIGGSELGVVKTATSWGTNVRSDGVLETVPATIGVIQAAANQRQPIVPIHQHESVFYGLAKAGGDTTQSQSSNAVGLYTPEAKGAIQQMLGISNLLAPSETTTASKAYSIGEVFTSNGKLYKATAAIAAAETIIVQNEGETISEHNAEEVKISDEFVKKTDYATANDYGLVKSGGTAIGINANGQLYVNTNSAYGVRSYSGTLAISEASAAEIKTGTTTWKSLTPGYQHAAAFYGLAKAAGDTTQSQSDNAVGTYTDDAKAAIRTMLGAVGSEDYATSDIAGIIKASDPDCLTVSNGLLKVKKSALASIKACSGTSVVLVPSQVNSIAFYGLAHASGDTTQSSSSNAVGQYTDNAKASIKAMLGIVDGSTGTVTVSGTTPTITAVENTRYVCGEVATLSITPPASGICIIRFTSGTTATVLTATGIVWPEWFDATELEASRIYEICITDGYGAVMSWAL